MNRGRKWWRTIDKQKGKPLSLAAMVILLLLSMLLRMEMLRYKKTLEYDEPISYLAATCHQGEYDALSFATAPRPASFWQDYLRIDKLFCFRQIAHDLARTDIHPPLYFWLLHLWMIGVGTTVHTGPLLNNLFALLTTAALFGLARDLLQSRREALLVTGTYVLNPSILLITKEARQYDLLALLTVLVVWQTLRLLNGKAKWPSPLLLGLLTLAGSLAHYQFVVLVAGCSLYALADWVRSQITLDFARRKHPGSAPINSTLINGCVRWRRASRKPILLTIAALGFGYGAAFLIHPYFLLSLQQQSSRAPAPSWSEFQVRVANVMTAFVSFYYLLGALLVILLLIGFMHLLGRSDWRRHLNKESLAGSQILLFAVWFAAVILGMYLAFRSPTHAVGPPKYLSTVWPFLAFLPVFILRMVHHRTTVTLFLVGLPVLLALLFPLQMRLFQLDDPTPQMANANLVIVDNPARGVFFPVLWHIPPDTNVIAAYQNSLIADKIWMQTLPENTLYVSENSFRNSATKQQRLLTSFQEHGYEVVPISGGIVTRGTAYAAFMLQPSR